MAVFNGPVRLRVGLKRVTAAEEAPGVAWPYAPPRPAQPHGVGSFSLHGNSATQLFRR